MVGPQVNAKAQLLVIFCQSRQKLLPSFFQPEIESLLKVELYVKRKKDTVEPRYKEVGYNKTLL